MIARLPFLLTTLAALPLLALDAHAGGGITIGIGHQGKHGSVGIQVGIPLGSHRPAPPQYGGHWETVVERTWIPGTFTQVWIEPRYETRYDACGRPIQVCVRAGYWDTRQTPGHYEERTCRVWRPATCAPVGWKKSHH